MIDAQGEIIPINSNNVDYYQWGLNCKILNFTSEEASKCINPSIAMEKATAENVDMFWEGFTAEKPITQKINIDAFPNNFRCICAYCGSELESQARFNTEQQNFVIEVKFCPACLAELKAKNHN